VPGIAADRIARLPGGDSRDSDTWAQSRQRGYRLAIPNPEQAEL